MQEVESIKNYYIKQYGTNIKKYLDNSKLNDLRFTKYYMMDNINFYFSKNINDSHLFKAVVFLDAIFLKNIFFYYKRYLTSFEIEYLCSNVNDNIYVYIVDQQFPEKTSISYKHMINRINFLLPIFFHSTTYEFYCNARCRYKLTKKLIKIIREYNNKSYKIKLKTLINEDFNIFTLGLDSHINKINYSINKEFIFDNDLHYYFFGMKIIDYSIILNKWVNSLNNINTIYYIIIYITRLKLNSNFYNINKEFIDEIKLKWKKTIKGLNKNEIKFLKNKTNYNKEFIINLV